MSSATPISSVPSGSRTASAESSMRASMSWPMRCQRHSPMGMFGPVGYARWASGQAARSRSSWLRVRTDQVTTPAVPPAMHSPSQASRPRSHGWQVEGLGGSGLAAGHARHDERDRRSLDRHAESHV
jgi:hypothetical protein